MAAGKLRGPKQYAQVSNTAIASTQWVSTQDACRELKLSRTTIQRLKNRGILAAGTCYYRRGLGRTAPTAWNVEACRAVLQRLAAADPASIETYLLPTGRDA